MEKSHLVVRPKTLLQLMFLISREPKDQKFNKKGCNDVMKIEQKSHYRQKLPRDQLRNLKHVVVSVIICTSGDVRR